MLHHGFRPTLVEHSPQLRRGGYIIDFWGLGYDLVERMGGEMGCASKPGEGATFWVRLPLNVAEIDGAASSAPLEPVVRAANDADATGAPLHILLADDHPANRKVVEVLLSVADVNIVAVEDGQKAVDAYRKDRFDLILMDMQMPVMDGLSATRAIREIEQRLGLPRTPLLMLTANAMAEHVAAGAEAGADGHLSKPVTSDRLFAAVEAALAERPAAQPDEDAA